MNKSVYTEKYVLFLDILGFEAYTTGDEKSEDFAKKVLPVFQDIVTSIKNFKSECNYSNSNFSQFSDTFIISSSVLAEILMHTEILIVMLLQIDLLTRGAITYGKVFHNGSQFIGPAINRAYNLEKSQAIYPRIIVESESFPSDDSAIFNDPSIMKQEIIEDSDGQPCYRFYMQPSPIKQDFDGLDYVHCSLFDEDYRYRFTALHEKVKTDKNYWKFKSKYIWFKKTYFPEQNA